MKKLTESLPRLLFAGSLPVLLLGFVCLVLLGGCAAPPSSVERYFFDVQTNVVPVVVFKTNEVTRIETVTNEAGAVTIQPLREVIITQGTNYSEVISVNPSAAFHTWGDLVAGILNVLVPGSGGIVGAVLIGFAGIYGWRKRSALQVANDNLQGHAARVDTLETVAGISSQAIETAREIIKAMPNGADVDAKFAALLQKNQLTAGVLREAVAIMRQSVSGDEAKRLADKLTAILTPAPAA